jgi:hypothetical protein
MDPFVRPSDKISGAWMESGRGRKYWKTCIFFCHFSKILTCRLWIQSVLSVSVCCECSDVVLNTSEPHVSLNSFLPSYSVSSSSPSTTNLLWFPLKHGSWKSCWILMASMAVPPQAPFVQLEITAFSHTSVWNHRIPKILHSHWYLYWALYWNCGTLHRPCSTLFLSVTLEFKDNMCVVFQIARTWWTPHHSHTSISTFHPLCLDNKCDLHSKMSRLYFMR